MGHTCANKICMTTDNLCLNDGECNQVTLKNDNNIIDHTSLCKCQANYYGENCENLKKCPENYCMNNGVCKMVNETPICTCDENHTGEKCDFRKSKCPFCDDHQYCELTRNGYKCHENLKDNPSKFTCTNSQCSSNYCIEELNCINCDENSYECSIDIEAREKKCNAIITDETTSDPTTTIMNDSQDHDVSNSTYKFKDKIDHFALHEIEHENNVLILKYLRISVIGVISLFIVILISIVIYFQYKIKKQRKLLESEICPQNFPLKRLNGRISRNSTRQSVNVNNLINEKKTSHYYSTFTIN